MPVKGDVGPIECRSLLPRDIAIGGNFPFALAQPMAAQLMTILPVSRLLNFMGALSWPKSVIFEM